MRTPRLHFVSTVLALACVSVRSLPTIRNEDYWEEISAETLTAKPVTTKIKDKSKGKQESDRKEVDPLHWRCPNRQKAKGKPTTAVGTKATAKESGVDKTKGKAGENKNEAGGKKGKASLLLTQAAAGRKGKVGGKGKLVAGKRTAKATKPKTTPKVKAKGVKGKGKLPMKCGWDGTMKATPTPPHHSIPVHPHTSHPAMVPVADLS